MSPPTLAGILVNGGTLRVADKDVNLLAHRILLQNEGALQAGTKRTPFQHNLNITLVGSRDSSEEHPVFGAKALAVEGGILSLFGRDHVSWTRLSATAVKGDNCVVLDRVVRSWDTGFTVVITSTDFDAHQSEVRTIKNVTSSTSKSTVCFTEPLSYSHFGELQYFMDSHGNATGKVLDERAEVGLLSRNIIIQGDSTSASEEFGCQVMATGGQVQLSNVEVAYCGQRSSLARYPVHFHLAQNVSGSYIRSCSIHHNYNRAVAIHGVHGLTISKNVVYDTMGHAIFVEDGIETKNVVSYNLVVLTKAAPSLLQTDQVRAFEMKVIFFSHLIFFLEDTCLVLDQQPRQRLPR
jgi:cell migration-inducing and hyaluronan-binding protein